MTSESLAPESGRPYVIQGHCIELISLRLCEDGRTVSFHAESDDGDTVFGYIIEMPCRMTPEGMGDPEGWINAVLDTFDQIAWRQLT